MQRRIRDIVLDIAEDMIWLTFWVVGTAYLIWAVLFTLLGLH